MPGGRGEGASKKSGERPARSTGPRIGDVFVRRSGRMRPLSGSHSRQRRSRVVRVSAHPVVVGAVLPRARRDYAPVALGLATWRQRRSSLPRGCDDLGFGLPPDGGRGRHSGAGPSGRRRSRSRMASPSAWEAPAVMPASSFPAGDGIVAGVVDDRASSPTGSPGSGPDGAVRARNPRRYVVASRSRSAESSQVRTARLWSASWRTRSSVLVRMSLWGLPWRRVRWVTGSSTSSMRWWMC
jgi:hypothetical protein